ncbi:MAG TPA: 16S rRNA (guanine(527)-N(7))-methyltransferase RsmG [Limnochordia bacterium]|nr:16S rRNA (guanine(527)-N(7))-methyltransferase RsmG [Limnochordia bacterium]
MADFAERMLVANASLNLTRITGEDEIAVKHFVDSLSLLRLGVVQRAPRMVDVGSGAGFPGVPLAIARPDATVVLVDSLRKRMDWVAMTMRDLGLTRVSTVHARAEEAGRGALRGRFGLAVARAVAPAPVALEYLAPLTAVGGHCVLMKGPVAAGEIAAGERAAAALGLRELGLDRFELPDGMGERTLMSWVKEGRTPSRYPRRAGVPQREPLGGPA